MKIINIKKVQQRTGRQAEHGELFHVGSTLVQFTTEPDAHGKYCSGCKFDDNDFSALCSDTNCGGGRFAFVGIINTVV